MSTTISRSSTRPTSPPAYSIRSSSSSYPVFLPSLFKIGFHRVSPLVTVAEVQDHLRLLGAFYTLQRHVETIAVHERRDPEIAWGIFLSRAVYRFNIWVNTLQTSKQGTIPDVFMPPIDVIMVWHTYLLVSITRPVQSSYFISRVLCLERQELTLALFIFLFYSIGVKEPSRILRRHPAHRALPTTHNVIPPTRSSRRNRRRHAHPPQTAALPRRRLENAHLPRLRAPLQHETGGSGGGAVPDLSGECSDVCAVDHGHGTRVCASWVHWEVSVVSRDVHEGGVLYIYF